MQDVEEYMKETLCRLALHEYLSSASSNLTLNPCGLLDVESLLKKKESRAEDVELNQTLGNNKLEEKHVGSCILVQTGISS